MMVLGEFYTFYQKILYAQKAQNTHKQIKTKTVLNTHKTSKRKKVACLVQKAQNAHKHYKTSKKKKLFGNFIPFTKRSYKHKKHKTHISK